MSSYFINRNFPTSLPFSDSSEHLVIAFRELDELTNRKGLGLQLGLHFSTFQNIEQDEQATNHCLMATLHSWMSVHDSVKDVGGATRNFLVTALYEVEENSLAHRIQSKGSSSSPSPTFSRELHSQLIPMHFNAWH